MIEHSGKQVARLGIWRSVWHHHRPYKLYATWSGILGQSFSTFLLASAIAQDQLGSSSQPPNADHL